MTIIIIIIIIILWLINTSSGAQGGISTGFAIYADNTSITFEAYDGIEQWMTTHPYSFGENWTSVAMSWDAEYGITAFIDGIAMIEGK